MPLTKCRRKEKGIILFSVLGVGVVIILVGAATLSMLRRHLKQAGEQRKDFQSLHAAEAGIRFFQNRLNAIPLCHPWFTYQDSLALEMLLRDTTISLPTPFGITRGFRLNNARIMPGLRPVHIRFQSTGGRILPDGSLDARNGRPVVCDIRLRTLADYVYFSENATNAYFSTGAVVKGLVHAGGGMIATGDVDFQKKVTFTGTLSVSGPGVTFRKGYERLDSAPLDLNHIYLPMAQPRAPCGGSLPKTYEELARGLVPHEGKGFFYSGPVKSLFVNLDSIRYQGGSVRFPLYAFDSTEANHRGPQLMNASLPVGQFNGVVYLDGDVFLEGRLTGVSLTVAVSDDILATNNIFCSGGEAASDNRVALGLIAQSKFFMWGRTPTRLTIEAAVIALDDALFNFGGFDRDPIEFAYPNTTLLSWLALGSGSSHPGVDAAGNPASALNEANWVLTLRGSIISKLGGGVIPPNWQLPGMVRNYEFDPDNTYSPPPKMGMLHSPAPGTPMWEVKGWEEK